MTLSKDPIVLDKSFIQGSSREKMYELSERYELFITSSFYFETFTNLESSHQKIFYKLPNFHRVHIPALLRQELETQQSVRSVPFKLLAVNPQFISTRRTLDDEEESLLKEFESHTVQPNIEFWQQVMLQSVIGFSNSEIETVLGSEERLIKLCRRLLDKKFIQNTAERCGVHISHLLDDTWLTFRVFQVKLLHGVLLKYYYPSNVPPRNNVDLEHDVHDLEYLALGLHCHNFATLESTRDIRKLGWKFKFLHPRGNLVR